MKWAIAAVIVAAASLATLEPSTVRADAPTRDVQSVDMTLRSVNATNGTNSNDGASGVAGASSKPPAISVANASVAEEGASIVFTSRRTSSQASSTLELKALLSTTFAPVGCGSGTSSATTCYSWTGSGVVAGLGTVTSTYTDFWDGSDPSCAHGHLTGMFSVAGKGEIDVSARAPDCLDGGADDGRLDDDDSSQSFNFTVIGGSGTYAGASGSGTLRSGFSASENGTGSGTDTWSGTITVPGYSFDTTPPTISGAVSKTVRVPKRAKRVRVSYKVTAQDAVDGAVPVTCKPPPGSRFKVGRTKVTCTTGTDSSGNTAIATFTITVKRRH
jgi:hypothetical protein